MSENSLICATVSQARKLVRLRYPIAPMMMSTIIGLPISTNAEKRIASPRVAPSSDKSSRAPRSMKKNSNRKSRTVTRRLPIASRYGVDASDAPATNAPTSLLKPNASPTAASATAHAMPASTSSSGVRARCVVTPGRTRMASPATTIRNPTPLSAMVAA